MRLAYFTAGSVGAGHAVRGLALGHALRRTGRPFTYRVFAPEGPFRAAEGPWTERVQIRREELQVPSAADGALARQLRAFRPDLLLVDMFWAPLRHVLPALACPAWLLVRKCPDRWFTGPPSAPFEPRQFQRIFAIEPFAPPVPHEPLDPVVIVNPDERQPEGSLRAKLGVTSSRRLVVALHAGVAGELDALAAADADVMRLDLAAPDALFPAAAWLHDADLILAGAGYNSFWEARWLDYAGRCRFTPFARPIDDQAWRLRACADVTPRQNGADALIRAALGG
ncbi:MAG: hypothetical protein ACK4N5_20715 [Myxococcales bacterium]